MSSPLTYGIAANAKNADCAAFFFNWVATNATARQIDVSVGGSYPGGPPDLPVPPAASGSIINQTLAAAQTVFKDNGTMGFIANATGSIFAQGWTPELQMMVGGKETAAGMLKYVQAQYLQELGS
jgi:raffinose/stachyose/melibiose transport system substrate-binding protein